jgi:hypothetical protein
LQDSCADAGNNLDKSPFASLTTTWPMSTASLVHQDERGVKARASHVAGHGGVIDEYHRAARLISWDFMSDSVR